MKRLAAFALAAFAAAGLATGSAALAGAGGAGADWNPTIGLPDAATPVKLGPGFERITTRVGGMTREYHLMVPPGVRAGAPLVIAFHGGGQNAGRFAKGVGLSEMARRHGFVLALPEGVGGPGGKGQSWNTGSTVPQGYAEINGVDDLGFVSKMLNEIIARGVVDRNRVYAMGVSRGGMMSYQVACNLPDRFAAIAVVAATLSSGRCADPDGVSLLHIHGTNDKRVPWTGGQGRFTAPGAAWESAANGIAIFAQQAQCRIDWNADRVAPDTICYTTDCPGSDEVEYCLIENGGHAWPGVATTRRQERQGVYSSPYFNATEYIARFFKAH